METQYKLERGLSALWVVIDTTKNKKSLIAAFENEDDANTFLEIKNAVQENTDPKKITVEMVYDEVSTAYYLEADGDSNLSSYKKYSFDKNNVPTEQHAKQVLAFCQLLTCAYWANGGVMPVPNGKKSYRPYWSHGKFVKTYNENVIEFPFYLTSEAYDKFMEIDGIEPLLHTFLNTGK